MTGLSGARMFPDAKVECYGCGHAPHQVGRCPTPTILRKTCLCTTPPTDTLAIYRSGQP